jgi:DnaJ-class molecular chaperone
VRGFRNCICRGIDGSVLTLGILILIIIIAVAGYFVSLRIHPLVKCRLCNGTGRHYGGVYTYAHRRCRKCGGNGRRDRFGNRFFG